MLIMFTYSTSHLLTDNVFFQTKLLLTSSCIIDNGKSLTIKIDEAFSISLAIICCSNRLILLVWIKDL